MGFCGRGAHVELCRHFFGTLSSRQELDNLTLASPVAVDNQIFIRTADYLYCIQKK